MRRLRSLTACLLLALWLPATLHCDMETAGIEGIFGCHEDESSGKAHCPDDVCHSIEGLSYKLDSFALTVPPPALALFCLLCPPPMATPALAPTLVVAEASTSPPEVARTWHFLARAAPPARAPSFLG